MGDPRDRAIGRAGICKSLPPPAFLRRLLKPRRTLQAPLKIRTNSIHPALEDKPLAGPASHLRCAEVANVAAFLVSDKAGYINGLTAAVVRSSPDWISK